MKRALVICLVLAAAVIPATPAAAHNQYEDAYRRWPWYAGESRPLTTLPGECPHCPGAESSSAWKAIDVDMNYETVYSIAPGKVERYEPSGGGAGKYLAIADADGTFIIYEHLSKALTTKGSVVAGEPIAVSGCTGNCSGAHLHFQRSTRPSFSSTALDLTPLSGHGAPDHTSYASDNAGIGYSAGGNTSTSIERAYANAGGYAGFGTPGDLGVDWTPCRTDGARGTGFRQGCNPRSGTGGSLQTYLGPGEMPRAIMHRTGDADSYILSTGTLGAYTEIYNGHDWVWWLGYPTGDRFKLTGSTWRQNFEDGYIKFTAPCDERIFMNNVEVGRYGVCE